MAARRTGKKVRATRTGRTDVAGSTRRLAIGRMALVMALALAGVKLVSIQAFEASELSKEVNEQLVIEQAIQARRGRILGGNGRVLAFSVEARKLYANPKLAATTQAQAHAEDPSKPTAEEEKRAIAAYIARVTHGEISEQRVLDELFSGEQFLYFGSLVDLATARKIRKRFPQIGAEYRAVRKYPADGVAATIIGAATWNKGKREIRGLVGLESALNKVLSGKDGLRVAKTMQGSSVVIPGTERILKPVQPGSDVQLTINSDLQYILQQKLAAYIEETGAEGGSAVVLDAQTGEVRALATGHTFDPGSRETWTAEKLSNPAVTTPFEPGSVNKIITMAGAIEYGIAEPKTVFQVPGQIEMGGVTVSDAWAHGTLSLTLTGILAKSSNVGTLMVAQKLGKDRFMSLVDKFGLGQQTGIALPGESAGRVPPRENWSASTFANLPIGQGLSMTVLQMAGMYQAIANGGVRIPPRIIEATIKPDGERVPHPRPEGVRVVSEKTADTVVNMLQGTVQDIPGQTGTAPQADLIGYQIAGKTGTAQQVDPSCGCYSNSQYWITFAGILPANNPQFVVGIMIDAPEGTRTAAPLFHDIAEYLTQRYQIPLSDKPTPKLKLRVP